MSKSKMPSLGIVVLCVGFVFGGFWAYAKFNDRNPKEGTLIQPPTVINEPTKISDREQDLAASNGVEPKSADEVMAEIQSQRNADIPLQNQSDEPIGISQMQSPSSGVNLTPKPETFEIMDINEAKEAIPLIISLMDIDHNQKRDSQQTLNCRRVMFAIHPDIYNKMSEDLGFNVSYFLGDMITLKEAWLRGDSLNYGREMGELFDRENALMSYCLDRPWNRLTAMYWTRDR